MKRKFNWGLKEWLTFWGVLLLCVIIGLLLALVLPMGITYVFSGLYPDVDSNLMIDVVFCWSVCVIFILLAGVLILIKNKFYFAYATMAMIVLVCAIGGWISYKDIKAGPQTGEMREAVVEGRRGDYLTGFIDGERISLSIPTDTDAFLKRGNEYEYIVVEYYANKKELIKVIERKRKKMSIQEVQEMLSELWDE